MGRKDHCDRVGDGANVGRVTVVERVGVSVPDAGRTLGVRNG